MSESTYGKMSEGQRCPKIALSQTELFWRDDGRRNSYLSLHEIK